MRQRIDFNGALHGVDRLETGERIRAVDVHGTRTADSLSARATERERRVDLILDRYQRIQNHGTAVIQVHLVGIQLWVLAGRGIVSIDPELAVILGAIRRGIGSTTLHS